MGRSGKEKGARPGGGTFWIHAPEPDTLIDSAGFGPYSRHRVNTFVLPRDIKGFREVNGSGYGPRRRHSVSGRPRRTSPSARPNAPAPS